MLSLSRCATRHQPAALQTWRRALSSPKTSGSALKVRNNAEVATEAVENEDDEDYEDEDLLEGKKSGDNLRRAFLERSAAAMRFEYFAQRAELEAELEAAAAFRSITEVAKQQSLGFLELLEEHGSHVDSAGAINIGATLDNVATAALGEKTDSDSYLAMSEAAKGEDLEQLSEWMGDMAEAASRTADRLELVSSLMDSEFDDEEADQDDDSNEDGPVGAGKSV
jgi:rubrerythrin